MLRVLFVKLITVGYKLVAGFDQLQVTRNKDQERRKRSILENGGVPSRKSVAVSESAATLRSKVSAEKRGLTTKSPSGRKEGGRN